ncbi:unnamed protein product [Orchesella dallaii]|uniref:LIM zinc-binding domain-containing protein n=1 Tax=Orchesella dallaii TaxID=48710 RepID=A0ABP1REB9_9HEXA
MVKLKEYLDTTFRRSSKKSSSTGLVTPSPTKTESFTYDRIPDSLSSPSSGFRSRSPSLELKTTIIDTTLNNANYRECFSCKMPIFHFQEHLFAQDRLWHSDCFTCTQCTRKLDPETFKEKNGQPYCEMDYNTMFLPRCYACRKTIPESILPINILKDYYHPECFTCRKCSQVLCPYVHFERNGSYYCEEDYHWLFSPKCATCCEPIRDKTKLTLAMGNTYHEEHFVCFECTRPLPGNSFWKKNGVVYCEEDYHKLFSPKCDRCLEPIRHDGLLALGKKWHRDCCLRCEICDKILREDNYFTEDNKAYCRVDWIKNFAPRCYDCKRPIAEVLKGTAVYALGRQYHPVCFVCQDCNKVS